MMRSNEDGFTLIELLVTVTIFAVVSVGFYQVMFSATRGSGTSRSVTRVSEEARLGIDRMVRDTREAGIINNPTPTSYEIQVDFDASGTIAVGANAQGDYEHLRYRFTGDSILIGIPAGAGAWTEYVLTDGVDCLNGQRNGDGSCVTPVFSYTSNDLQYDTNNDGVTDQNELDTATGTLTGDRNGSLNGQELESVTSVNFAFQVAVDDHRTDFSAEAQMRNLRTGGSS